MSRLEQFESLDDSELNGLWWPKLSAESVTVLAFLLSFTLCHHIVVLLLGFLDEMMLSTCMSI